MIERKTWTDELPFFSFLTRIFLHFRKVEPQTFPENDEAPVALEDNTPREKFALELNANGVTVSLRREIKN